MFNSSILEDSSIKHSTSSQSANDDDTISTETRADTNIPLITDNPDLKSFKIYGLI